MDGLLKKVENMHIDMKATNKRNEKKFEECAKRLTLNDTTLRVLRFNWRKSLKYCIEGHKRNTFEKCSSQRTMSYYHLEK